MEEVDDGIERGSFPRTRWTLVEELRQGGEDGERALATLCEAYWYPVYAFLRRTGAEPADAEDLAQGFFLQLLSRGSLASADARKGKLRTFLLTALKRFRVSEFRKGERLKRGGGVTVVSLDREDAEERFRDEPADLADPEVLFERRWALSLVDLALERLGEEYAAAGKAALFEELGVFLAGKDHPGARYAELAERLEMSPGALHVAVHRLRKRFRRQIELAVAETVEDPSEIDAELDHLFQVLSSG